MGQTISPLLIPTRDKSIPQIFRFLLSPPLFIATCRPLISSLLSYFIIANPFTRAAIGKDFFHFFMKCMSALIISSGLLTLWSRRPKLSCAAVHLSRVHLSMPESCLLPGKNMRTLPESPALLHIRASPGSTSSAHADTRLGAVLVSGLGAAAVHCCAGGGPESKHVFECEVQWADISLLSSQRVSVSSLETLPGTGNLAVFGLHNFSLAACSREDRVHGSLTETFSLGSLQC